MSPARLLPQARGQINHRYDHQTKREEFHPAYVHSCSCLLYTSGLKRRRLRELWAFLQCGLANLGDSDPDWIQTTEEQAVLDLARSILIFEEAVLPGEAVNLAVRALEAEPALRQRFGSPVVLADDYLLMLSLIHI